jgi:glycosyltransferase involved in cell wall biosynthesis
VSRLERVRGRRQVEGVGRPQVLLVVENVPLARDHRLRKQVEALLSDGIDVSVLCPADPGNARTGVPLYEFPPPAPAASKLGFLREYGYSWVMTGIRLAQASRVTRFNGIQIAGNPDIYFPLTLPHRWLGRSVVFDQRDPAPEVYQARYGSRPSLILKALLGLERLSFRAVDRVLVVNERLRQTALGRGRCEEADVAIVGNGPVLTKAWRRAPSPELKQGRPHLAVWLGLMGPQDSVEVALRAVHRLVHLRGRRDCQFAFVGDGDARAGLERLAADLHIEEWVDFPGWADEDLAFTYLSTADLGLEPNLEEVVSPVKVQEYMAFQLPVVAFDLPETRRVAEPAALLATPGDIDGFADAIEVLLDDPGRRSALGCSGRRHVEQQLAWDRQRETYLEVWRDLLPRRAGGPTPRPSPTAATSASTGRPTPHAVGAR